MDQVQPECPFFERPSVRTVGIVAFFFLAGLAAGNGWATRDAMVGQARWLNDRCGQTVKKVVDKHMQEDRETFGFTPEDVILKDAPLPKAKK